MNKIAEILDVNIYDADRLFAYEFSFRMMDYLKHRGTVDSIDFM